MLSIYCPSWYILWCTGWSDPVVESIFAPGIKNCGLKTFSLFLRRGQQISKNAILVRGRVLFASPWQNDSTLFKRLCYLWLHADTIPTSPSSRVLLSYFLLVFAQRKLEKEMTESYEDYERVRCFSLSCRWLLFCVWRNPFQNFGNSNRGKISCLPAFLNSFHVSFFLI